MKVPPRQTIEHNGTIYNAGEEIPGLKRIEEMKPKEDSSKVELDSEIIIKKKSKSKSKRKEA